MAEGWDIELINDEKEIREKLDSGPQLFQVLNKDIEPDVLFKVVGNFYTFVAEIDGEERIVLLMGAYKSQTIPEATSEDAQRIFKEPIGENFTQELLYQGDIPYLPMSPELSENVINTMRRVYDIREIQIDGRTQHGIRCIYYDINTEKPRAGKVISQYQV